MGYTMLGVIRDNRMDDDEFFDLYFKTVEDHHYLGWFLQGHLVLEFILRKIVIGYDQKLTNLINNLNHAGLIGVAFDIGAISDKQREVLILINKIRNKFAHKLDYIPPINEFRELWQKAKLAFTDMTDGIDQGLDELNSVNTIEEAEDYAIKELFVQISYDLEEIYHNVTSQN